MVNTTSEDLKNLLSYCIEIGLCLRCRLRYLGEIYSSIVFIKTDTDVKNKINELVCLSSNLKDSCQNKKQTVNYCFCCLGILQNGCETDFIDKILDKVKQFEYKFKKFQVNLFIPISVTLRENIVNAKLLTKFPHLNIHLKNCYTVKDVYRYVVIRRVSEISNSRINIEARTEIKIVLSYGNLQNECMELYKYCKNLFNLKLNNKLDTVFNHSSITRAITNLPTKTLINLNIEIPDRCFKLDEITISNLPLYLAGRYNKFSRIISQTQWIIDEEVKKDSLEEIICKQIVEFIPCENTKFSAAGREDVDVRMLGKGRPFVIEIFNPYNLDIDKNVLCLIEQNISKSSNNLVRVNHLQFTNKEDVAFNLKDGESNKIKIYTAFCICNREITEDDILKINKIQNLEIDQKTPIRVLHRRCLATRKRIIYNMSITPLENKKEFNLKIETQAGTYIKEFVHGDFGRTNPSLEKLLGNCETDIMELDVLEVLMDWPPEIK